MNFTRFHDEKHSIVEGSSWIFVANTEVLPPRAGVSLNMFATLLDVPWSVVG